MKREMKFRAWIPNTGWLADGFSIAMDGTEWYDDNGHSWPLSQLELMQFTGLKDKNGKEIYEGDIVKFAVKRKLCDFCASKEISSELKYASSTFCPHCGTKVKDIDFITVAEVVFDKGGFAYKWSNEESYYQSWQTFINEIYLEWTEVIGNIYENPELL